VGWREGVGVEAGEWVSSCLVEGEEREMGRGERYGNERGRVRGTDVGGSLREDILGLAVFGVDEGFGLRVAVGRDETAAGDGAVRERLGEEEGWAEGIGGWL
jgi:hypothetical protein